MKSLLTTTALFEAVTGLGLAIAPSFIVSQLLGTSLTDPSAVLIGRLAGGALITIAIACWLSRNDSQTSVMVKAMLSYNVFALTLLVYAAFVERISWSGFMASRFTTFWIIVLVFRILAKNWAEGNLISGNSIKKACHESFPSRFQVIILML